MTYASQTPTRERDEYRTPRYLYRFAESLYGRFDVDLAASRLNAIVSKFFTRADNALRQNWSDAGERGWCNPPYSHITPWIQKAIHESQGGFPTVMLLPTLNGDSRDALVLEYAYEINFIVGRVAFKRPDGRLAKGNTRGSCLVWFRHATPGARGPRIRSANRDEIMRRYGW